MLSYVYIVCGKLWGTKSWQHIALHCDVDVVGTLIYIYIYIYIIYYIYYIYYI
jgi:hypothetical protein